MKNWIAAFLFLVSWQEYGLKPVCEIYALENTACWDKTKSEVSVPTYYTIETVDHSVKLKTQKDVDLFVGKEGTPVITGKYIGTSQQQLWWENPKTIGIIGNKAFNITVKEVKE